MNIKKGHLGFGEKGTFELWVDNCGNGFYHIPADILAWNFRLGFSTEISGKFVKLVRRNMRPNLFH
jgi:hypothetical protein